MKKLLIILAIAFCAFGLTGCSTEQIQQAATEARKVYAPTTQAIAALDEEIAKLPEGDPVRKAYEEKRQLLADNLRRLDVIIAAGEKAQVTPELLQEASKLPVVGPYVGIIALLGLSVYKGIEAAKAKKAVSQIVAGLDDALPVKTHEQKLKLSAAQDESTKALVKLAKGE